jgi:hypothetical protein
MVKTIPVCTTEATSPEVMEWTIARDTVIFKFFGGEPALPKTLEGVMDRVRLALGPVQVEHRVTTTHHYIVRFKA